MRIFDRSFDLTDVDAALFAAVLAKQDRLAIPIAQVDPDGIGSAMGLAAIARHLGVESDVMYAGSFGHPQTRMLWETFGLGDRITRFSGIAPESSVALVDSSQTKDARFGGVELSPAIIIDHHGAALRDLTGDRFHYVAPCGAASSIVALLGMMLSVPFDSETCTLLALGIQTDTFGLTGISTGPMDRAMFASLMETGDQGALYRLSRFSMSERAFSIVQRLLTHKAIHGHGVLVAQPATLLDESEGEYLAFAADLLSGHKDARLVLVLGVAGDTIRVCARTREPSFPLGEVLHQLFGEGSGAKPGSGGACVILPYVLRGSRRRDDKFRVFLEQLEERIAALELP